MGTLFGGIRHIQAQPTGGNLRQTLLLKQRRQRIDIVRIWTADDVVDGHVTVQADLFAHLGF